MCMCVCRICRICCCKYYYNAGWKNFQRNVITMRYYYWCVCDITTSAIWLDYLKNAEKRRTVDFYTDDEWNSRREKSFVLKKIKKVNICRNYGDVETWDISLREVCCVQWLQWLPSHIIWRHIKCAQIWLKSDANLTQICRKMRAREIWRCDTGEFLYILQHNHTMPVC